MAWKQTAKKSAVLVMALLLLPLAVNADSQTGSAHYQVDEVFFGAGGQLDASSPNFRAKQSAGDLAVGKSCSTSDCIQAGFNSDRTPYIEMTVSGTNIDLGTLTPTSTKTATASFSVKAYLAHGYNVVTASPAPTNDAHVMASPASPVASSVGTEQFGINLVANTSPASFGSNPAYVPDNTFSFGQVDANYGTANVYKYAQGDRIAFSQASSSYTTYTIAYIFNISNVTPGGTYTMQHVLVATGTY